MAWKKTESELKPTNEDWSMSWQQGRREIEIVKSGRWFEVWEQIANKSKNPDSWDGEQLGSFKTKEEAVKFAKKYL